MNEALDNATDRWDFMYQPSPRCPHCGLECDARDMDVWSEGSHEVECPHCERPFIVFTEVRTYFSTHVQ